MTTAQLLAQATDAADRLDFATATDLYYKADVLLDQITEKQNEQIQNYQSCIHNKCNFQFPELLFAC